MKFFLVYSIVFLYLQFNQLLHRVLCYFFNNKNVIFFMLFIVMFGVFLFDLFVENETLPEFSSKIVIVAGK